jgi:hypothetical protein
VLLYVTDVVENPEKNMEFLEKVQKMKIPVILLINKIDELSGPSGHVGKTEATSQQQLGDIVTRWHTLLPNAEILPISAKNKFGIDMLLKRIQELLPESPAYFDKDQLTDKPARFFVSEIIREKILLYYDKEIPYSVEVSVESFKETEKNIHIRADEPPEGETGVQRKNRHTNRKDHQPVPDDGIPEAAFCFSHGSFFLLCAALRGPFRRARLICRLRTDHKRPSPPGPVPAPHPAGGSTDPPFRDPRIQNRQTVPRSA